MVFQSFRYATEIQVGATAMNKKLSGGGIMGPIRSLRDLFTFAEAGPEKSH